MYTIQQAAAELDEVVFLVVYTMIVFVCGVVNSRGCLAMPLGKGHQKTRKKRGSLCAAELEYFTYSGRACLCCALQIQLGMDTWGYRVQAKIRRESPRELRVFVAASIRDG